MLKVNKGSHSRSPYLCITLTCGVKRGSSYRLGVYKEEIISVRQNLVLNMIRTLLAACVALVGLNGAQSAATTPGKNKLHTL